MRRLNVFLAVASLFGVAAQGGVVLTKTWNFDDDETGKPPKGFVVAVGEWKVAADADGKGKVLEQSAKNANPIFNIALAEGPKVKNVDLSVAIQAVAGTLDQGGGLVWRAKDPKNYYVARFNPLEDNFRVYKVVNGVRSKELRNADVKHRDGPFVVRVAMKDDHIECYLDGKKYLDVHDSTFSDPGKIGVWSKSDAQSKFDDLTLIGE